MNRSRWTGIEYDFWGWRVVGWIVAIVWVATLIFAWGALLAALGVVALALLVFVTWIWIIGLVMSIFE